MTEKKAVDEDGVGAEQVGVQLSELQGGKVVLDETKKEPPEGLGDGPTQLKVYPRRWVILAVVALLNNTNTMTWIAFAPIANHVNIFYGPDSATWFSMVYMMFTIPVGIFAMLADRLFGLRAAILTAAAANGIGGIIRLTSSFLPEHLRFPIGITGQAIASVAYPFIMFLPTKVAGTWFPDNQRAIATTIGVMSNPLGVLLANLISPQLVTDPKHVPFLNILIFIPSFIAMILAFIFVNRSKPKLPPTFAASKKQMDFLQGVKKCFTSRQYVLLFIVMGGGIGMFNTLYTIMQTLLCPSGYSNSFAGLCAAFMIIGGVFGAAGAGIFVDRTKMYEETMKVAMGLAVLFGLLFMQLSLHPHVSLPIAATCILFGISGLATYPVGLELSAECTFPVSEATSTGLIVLSGQVQSVLYIMLMKVFSRPLQPSRYGDQVCREREDDTANQPLDNTMAIMVFSAIASVLAVVLILLFKPKYRRVEAEKANRAAEDKANESAKLAGTGLPDPTQVTQPLNESTNA